MLPQLSIIVPAYNAENDISRCLNSLRGQIGADIEVIVVDDGSTDLTAGVVAEHRAEDGRVSLITIPNQGVSAARNIGLDAARGEYVTFVDADDWVEPDMYAPMLEIARSDNFDAIASDLIVHGPRSHKVETYSTRPGPYSEQDIRTALFPVLLATNALTRPWPYRIVTKLFRRSHLVVNQVRFPVGLQAAQDFAFSVEAMVAASSFYYLKGHTGYHYAWNDASRTRGALSTAWENYRQLDGEFARISVKHPLLEEQLKFAQLHGDLSALTYIYRDIGFCSWGESFTELVALLTEADRAAAFANLNWARMDIGKRLVCFFYRERRFGTLHVVLLLRATLQNLRRRLRRMGSAQ